MFERRVVLLGVFHTPGTEKNFNLSFYTGIYTELCFAVKIKTRHGILESIK